MFIFLVLLTALLVSVLAWQCDDWLEIKNKGLGGEVAPVLEAKDLEECKSKCAYKINCLGIMWNRNQISCNQIMELYFLANYSSDVYICTCKWKRIAATSTHPYNVVKSELNSLEACQYDCHLKRDSTCKNGFYFKSNQPLGSKCHFSKQQMLVRDPSAVHYSCLKEEAKSMIWLY